MNTEIASIILLHKNNKTKKNNKQKKQHCLYKKFSLKIIFFI